MKYFYKVPSDAASSKKERQKHINQTKHTLKFTWSVFHIAKHSIVLPFTAQQPNNLVRENSILPDKYYKKT